MANVAPCKECGGLKPGRRRKELCQRCYKAVLKAGDRVRVVVRGTVEERLLARLVPADNGCLMWPESSSVNNQGYGLINVGGGSHRLVHRVAYELWVAPLEGRKQVDHLCHDPKICTFIGADCPHRRCCNPAHLSLKTAKANNFRSGSPSGINARREECKNGHEFTLANTYIHPKRGTRHCRACALRRTDEWAARNPEAMQERWRAAGSKRKKHKAA